IGTRVSFTPWSFAHFSIMSSEASWIGFFMYPTLISRSCAAAENMPPERASATAPARHRRMKLRIVRSGIDTSLSLFGGPNFKFRLSRGRRAITHLREGDENPSRARFSGRLWPLFRRHRNCEEEGGAAAHRRFEPDPTPMHLDNAFRDCEPQSGAALLARDRIVSLLEFLEELGLIACGYTRAGVAHRDIEGAVRLGGLYHDLARIRELDGVSHQVEEDLRQPAFVTVPGRHVRCHLDLERQLLFAGQRLDHAEHRLHDIPERVVG